MEEELPLINLGDVMDKLTILTRKIYFGEEGAISEHRFLEKALEYYGIDGKIITNALKLCTMNAEIWNLENKMRRDSREINQLTQEELAEYGRRALEIRNLNRKRIEYKNEITDIYKAGYKEFKIQHASR